MTPRPSCPSLFPYTTLFRSCALCDPCCFSPGGPRLLGRCALGICKRYEVALPPIHGEEIRDHLPSYGQRGSIGRSEEHTSELQSLTNIICPLRLHKSINDHT